LEHHSLLRLQHTQADVAALENTAVPSGSILAGKADTMDTATPVSRLQWQGIVQLLYKKPLNSRGMATTSTQSQNERSE
jgi:hypothetical protein